MSTSWTLLPTVRLSAWLTSMTKKFLATCLAYKQSALHTTLTLSMTLLTALKLTQLLVLTNCLAATNCQGPDFGNITTAGVAGDSIPVAARLPGATALPTAYVSPAMLIARMGRLLDQKSVDKDGRWVVIDPVMMEILMDEDSRLLNADFGDSRCTA
jgi:hypothetical protein